MAHEEAIAKAREALNAANSLLTPQTRTVDRQLQVAQAWALIANAEVMSEYVFAIRR